MDTNWESGNIVRDSVIATGTVVLLQACKVAARTGGDHRPGLFGVTSAAKTLEDK